MEVSLSALHDMQLVSFSSRWAHFKELVEMRAIN